MVGLILVKITGAYWLDPVIALAVAAAIVVTGVRLLLGSSRVLVDEALPAEEVDEIREAIEEFAPRGVVGYHELRTRKAGARRYVDLHVQFRAGTSLEDAHRTAHELQDRIASRLRNADVLIHLEPEDRVRPGEVLRFSRHRATPGAGCPRAAPLGQVERGRSGDGQRDRRIAVVALDRQDRDRDQACAHGHQPSESSQVDAPMFVHVRIFAHRARRTWPARRAGSHPRPLAERSHPRPL